ncbi:UDP-glucose/GDP-mannose dehydrogenase family protein [Actinosynnema sp. NPDC050436]|uniref:UDP-glucose dehydrogenase family protein n=1 Tax=Actinosynnema sp. NPDC050436 TaxID=3155659 RepID=UPI0033F32FD2
MRSGSRVGASVLRISVIGSGYLGVTHAACMAELGYRVTGLDIDADKVARLNAGDVPFYEPGLAGLVEEHTASGRLRFTTSYEVAAQADVHFLCVGTPQRRGQDAADLSHLDAAVRRLAPLLGHDCLLVGKSTVPVGTAARILEAVSGLAPPSTTVDVAWNPEFLREGHAVADTLAPDRIVLGVVSERSEKVLKELYAPFVDRGTPLVVADLATAELTKSAANAFLATKVSFINAMAEVCEAVGADVTRLSEGLSHDPRIGDQFIRPGLGFGGGCLPKDLRAFQARARELGVGGALSFLGEVDAINTRRRSATVRLVREQCDGELARRRVAVLGGAFKPGSDDIRDSPALYVAEELSRSGARVVVHDPKANQNIRRHHPSLTCADTVLDACAQADVVVLATEWAEFADIDPAVLGAVVSHRRVVDARNALDAEQWKQAAWTYRALGRP